MSRTHKVYDSSKPYFLTSSVRSWEKIFRDDAIVSILIDSVIFCQQEKDLEIYSYCIMPDHLHILCRATGDIHLSDIFRDLKKFTTNKIIDYLRSNIDQESHNWLERFSFVRNNTTRYSVWNPGLHPIEVTDHKFIDQKVSYIHNNPVKAKLVLRPEEYAYSSAIDYSGGKGLIEVVVI